MKSGVPRELFPYVLEFTESVSPGHAPIYLPVTPGPKDEPKDCVNNVPRYIQERGGEMVSGWKIWEMYGLMIEGEFHTVWKSPSGELIDVTPNDPPVDRILFVPDPNLVYDNTQIDNIRHPLNNNPAIKEFIAGHQAYFEFMNRGERAHAHGEITLSDDEALEVVGIQRRVAEAGAKLSGIIPGRNEPCLCGSGKKSKKCCFK